MRIPSPVFAGRSLSPTKKQAPSSPDGNRESIIQLVDHNESSPKGPKLQYFMWPPVNFDDLESVKNSKRYKVEGPDALDLYTARQALKDEKDKVVSSLHQDELARGNGQIDYSKALQEIHKKQSELSTKQVDDIVSNLGQKIEAAQKSRLNTIA